MRLGSIALPLLLVASPAFAQSAPAELSDPKVAERLGAMSQALGKALLDMPVGELEAIAEGREPTPADRRRTVRETAPDLERQLAQAKPMMETNMKALSASLPAIMQSLQQAREAIERAAANMPSPNYPKR